MYTITHNGATLYDPRLQGLPVGSPKLTQEANTFDTLSFTLYPSHPAYNLLTKKDSILTVYRDNELLAQFIPAYKRRVFNGGIEYKCKSVIALLDDFYYRTTDYTGSVSGFISNIISSFNARVTSNYYIQPGNIHEGSVEYSAPNPRTFWKALQTVTENNGGYIVPRFSSGTIYLDYLTDTDLPVSDQKIVFGENLTDLFIETDTDNCFSVLYPFGTDEEDNVVSIASVNGGLDYLENISAVASYGRREKVITWTNVTSPSQLLSLAQAQLSKIATLFSESVQLSAVDLHDAGVSVSALKFLTSIDCISAPHNYSHRYPVTGMETVLDAPQSVTIKLGPIPMTLTESFALEREKNAATRAGGGGGRAQAKAENEFKRFETFYTQTDEKFSWLATDSEWDELAQAGHVTAYTELTRTAHFVEDTAAKELPYEDWKAQTQAADPTADVSEAAYRAWITANPYAIYNNVYSDATRTERIISKTGINNLGANETLESRIGQEADRITQIVQAVGSNGEVTAASIVAAVNGSGSSVVISADHIELDGETVALSLSGQEIRCDSLTATSIGTDTLDVSTGVFTNLSAGSLSANGLTIDGADASTSINSIGPATASGGQITIPWTRLDGSAGTPINFNIADTQYYRDGVSAAKASVSAYIVNGNNNPVSGRRTLTPGSSMTVYPATYVDGITSRNNDAALVITAGTTTITVNGWGISAAAGGGTIVNVSVNGAPYTHTFNNYP